jgi:hypothetical protein
MSTQQISQDQWEEFLSAFSAHNQTRQVIVDIESAEYGPQRVVDRRPLVAIEPDLKSEHEKTITVIAGDTQGDAPSSLTHQVLKPQSIWLKQDEQGNAQALDIETEDGRTIIQIS